MIGKIGAALKTPAVRALIAFVIVMVALIFALWPRTSAPKSGWTDTSQGATKEDVPPEMMAQAQTDAALPPCPNGGAAPAGSVLAGVFAECMADRKPVDVGSVVAGKPTVINMWAVWCLPCRRELPYFGQLAQNNPDVNVLAVHAQEGATKPYAILTFLAELGVRIPTVADIDGSVALALKAPRVYPSTILLRADGTVAAVLPQVFETYEDLVAAVNQHLGVTAS